MKSTEITQDMFPGCYIEPDWSHKEKLDLAPLYAIRIAAGAKICESPRGRHDFTSIIFEGSEYVLHNVNFKLCKQLAESFLGSYMQPKGYDPERTITLRQCPNLIIEGIRFMIDSMDEMISIDDNLTKMIWMVPDQGPCGYYRSVLPFRYMKANLSDSFYCESHTFLNTNTLRWFDAVIMHRFPPNGLLTVYQNLALCNKTMVYEYDDDIFNVPEWNVNAKYITHEVVERGRLALQFSDIVLASTQPLVDTSEKDITFTCPNLIDMNDVPSHLLVNRDIMCQHVGFKPRREDDGSVVFVNNKDGRIVTQEAAEETYNPVRILWAGSNTHDHDLEIVTIAVKRLIDKYGISIRFIFFGYCPPEFLSSTVSSGNTGHSFDVRDEYAHCVDYVHPVGMTQYYQAVEQLNADIAICPLYEHVFNLSKSNLKVLEMSAFGIPCIASDYGPYRFLNEYPGCGITVQDNGVSAKEAVDEWVKAIEELINNTGKRIVMSGKARDMVNQNFSWNMPSTNRNMWDEAFAKIREVSNSRKITIGTNDE